MELPIFNNFNNTVLVPPVYSKQAVTGILQRKTEKQITYMY